MISSGSIAVRLLEPDGRVHAIEGRAGESLMRAAVGAGIGGIAADCGGSLTCATCHVVVDPAWAARLPAPSADEAAMLDMTAAPREATSRLACQIVLDATLAGLEARLPSTQY